MLISVFWKRRLPKGDMTASEILEDGNAETDDETAQSSDVTQQVEKDAVADKEPVQKDGGWGWIVCLTTTLNFGTAVGLLNSVPNVHVMMLKEFSDDSTSFKTCKLSWNAVQINVL